jgi:riboflavin biosynthesis pyrimidine reductase
MTHAIRSMHDAILVGVGTVAKDNPSLTVRLVSGPSPLPLVVDTSLQCPPECKLLTSTSCRKPVLLCAPFDGTCVAGKPWTPGDDDASASTADKLETVRHRAAALSALGAVILPCATSLSAAASGCRIDLGTALRQACAVTGSKSVMIEGGSRIISSVLQTATGRTATGRTATGRTATGRTATGRTATGRTASPRSEPVQAATAASPVGAEAAMSPVSCIAHACVITVAPVLVGGTRAVASPMAPAAAPGTFDASRPRPRAQFPALRGSGAKPGLATVGSDHIVYGTLQIGDR